ncbi:ADP-ribosylglycohydrolase family protein [Dactylosporangium sp. CS-047395]|uniref:ADP-ribosylglycohydrolase family protein n=1 Tax=Dactylosporangium sp. CS-047395 TaxID=3239936 RepID=UPI003D89BFE0
MRFPGIAAARGVMLGLLLGDALGAARGKPPAAGPLRAGTGGQLACWTVEGMIRAHVRGMHKGITTVPGVVWYAYRRWAAVRGDVPAAGRDDAWWRDSGWLMHVPVLAERRGTAPATVAALGSGRQGTVAEPTGTSVGAHAVTRTLPAALCSWWTSDAGPAAQIAALTHTGEAITAAARAADLVAAVAQGTDLTEAVAGLPARELPPMPLVPASVLNLARSTPRDPSVLRRLAPNGAATSALAGGLYAAATVDAPAQIAEALTFAASAGDGGHAATVAGALLGARFGPGGLPVDLVARLELVWVGDTLARDLVQQVEESPSGNEYAPAPDATWWDRYPGF